MRYFLTNSTEISGYKNGWKILTTNKRWGILSILHNRFFFENFNSISKRKKNCQKSEDKQYNHTYTRFQEIEFSLSHNFKNNGASNLKFSTINE